MEKGQGIRALIPTGTLSELEAATDEEARRRGVEESKTATPQEVRRRGGEAGTVGREMVVEVPVGQFASNPFQPRKRWSAEEMAELVDSIRAHGILQPLIARRNGASLELVAGERRLTAARQLALETVPVIIRNATNRDMLELALVENLQREDMNPADAAEAYRQLMTEFNLTQEQVADRVGKSRPAIANAVRLLALPPAILESLRQGQIDAGHARALLGVQEPVLQTRVWKMVMRRGLSVRQTEALVARTHEARCFT